MWLFLFAIFYCQAVCAAEVPSYDVVIFSELSSLLAAEVDVSEYMKRRFEIYKSPSGNYESRIRLSKKEDVRQWYAHVYEAHAALREGLEPQQQERYDTMLTEINAAGRIVRKHFQALEEQR